MRRELSVFQTQMHLGSERAILKMLLLEAAELPAGQRILALDAVFGSKPASELDEAVELFLDGLYAGTKLDNTEGRLRMFGLSRKELLAENDAFLTLAGKLYDENQERLERGKEFSGASEMLTPKWMKALASADLSTGRKRHRGSAGRWGIFAQGRRRLRAVHDAGRVIGTPARTFDCQKMLGGSEARYGGMRTRPGQRREPVTRRLTRGIPESRAERQGSGRLPVRREYEGLGHDFAFHEEVTRSIHVDIRYVLWVADFVDDAQGLLRELGVK
jgi:hypothetical protein